MDRFNNDTKVFCFILSTRSGGLGKLFTKCKLLACFISYQLYLRVSHWNLVAGINLTGADTVIFYDRYVAKYCHVTSLFTICVAILLRPYSLCGNKTPATGTLLWMHKHRIEHIA
jgi:hypothetical protein